MKRKKRIIRKVFRLHPEEASDLLKIMERLRVKTVGGAVRQLIILYKKFQQFIS